jgi:hypothetical protein
LIENFSDDAERPPANCPRQLPHLRSSGCGNFQYEVLSKGQPGAKVNTRYRFGIEALQVGFDLVGPGRQSGEIIASGIVGNRFGFNTVWMLVAVIVTPGISALRASSTFLQLIELHLCRNGSEKDQPKRIATKE